MSKLKKIIATGIAVISILMGGTKVYVSRPVISMNKIAMDYVEDFEMRARMTIENVGGRPARNLRTSVYLIFNLNGKIEVGRIPVSPINSLVQKMPLNIDTDSVAWDPGVKPDYYMVAIAYTDWIRIPYPAQKFFYKKCNDPALSYTLCEITDMHTRDEIKNQIKIGSVTPSK